MAGMLRYIRPIFQSGQIGARGAKNTVEEKLGLPTKPKRPSSAFLSFLNSKRLDISSSHPNASSKDVVKIAAELWRKVDTNVKAELQDQFKKNMAMYMTEISNYEKKLTDKQRADIQEAVAAVKEVKEKKRERMAHVRRLRELGRPVRPLTSFLLFTRDEAASLSVPHSPTSLREQSQLLGAKWASLPASKKENYQQRAEEAKREYERELIAWESKMIKAGNLDVVRQKTIDELQANKKKRVLIPETGC